LTFWNFPDFFAGGAERRPVLFERKILSARRAGEKFPPLKPLHFSPARRNPIARKHAGEKFKLLLEIK
jgi:hypothetical protein